MTTTPPEQPDEPHRDPNLGADDHEPTVDYGRTEPTKPLDPPPAAGQAPPPPPGGFPPPGYGPSGPAYAAGPMAPYGIDPRTGIPFSDKSKIIAGVLQLLLPFGIGRFYIGDTGLGIAQLLVTLLTCGIGAIWPFIDGIILLVTDSKDSDGRPLRS